MMGCVLFHLYIAMREYFWDTQSVLLSEVRTRLERMEGAQSGLSRPGGKVWQDIPPELQFCRADPRFPSH